MQHLAKQGSVTALLQLSPDISQLFKPTVQATGPRPSGSRQCRRSNHSDGAFSLGGLGWN
ncbi:MAG: hypothetical protein HC824_00030 [Synechococcales cyanobacterium RM1_1_8]|nr:hypothetical protein [Synechococcales cyanobacterium RM1_1_8]